MGRTTRQGLPKASTPAGTSLVTMLPAPMTAFSPMVTPGRMTLPAPTHTPAPMVTGLLYCRPLRRSAGCRGWVAAVMVTLGPIITSSPM